MICSLQQFYGGDPMGWFRMPLYALRAYMRMVSRLKARGAMEQVTTLLVGTGNLKAEDSKAQMRAWGRTAKVRRPVHRPTEDEKMALMDSVGIQRV